MAMTLADLAGGMANETSYRDYQIACMESGRTPMPHAEWVKAGKPSK
jgi:hypothetical protein